MTGMQNMAAEAAEVRSEVTSEESEATLEAEGSGATLEDEGSGATLEDEGSGAGARGTLEAEGSGATFQAEVYPAKKNGGMMQHLNRECREREQHGGWEKIQCL